MTNPYHLLRLTPQRSLRGPWALENVPANQAGVALKVGTAANAGTERAVTRAGWISGISASFTVAPAGSTLVLTVTKNGSPISGCVLNVTVGATLGRSTTFDPPSVFNVVAGDRIGVTVTTDGSWSATTSDMLVDVEISSYSV